MCLRSELRAPKKSILKNDSVEESVAMTAAAARDGPATSTRSALKKDPSYEAPPPVSGSPLPPSSSWRGRSNSNSSCDDIGRTFSDVVIDPIPGQGRKSNPEVRGLFPS